MADQSLAENNLLLNLPGPTVFSLFQNFQALSSASSLTTLEEAAVKLCKSLTGATWVEVIIDDGDSWRVLGRLQAHSLLDKDESSLPGYVGLHGVSQLLNNPNSSSFYTAFASKLYPHSNMTKQRMQPTNVACVPILQKTSTQAVVMLFNKLDENSRVPAMFTDNDVQLVQSVGIGLTDGLNRLQYKVRAKKKVEMLKAQLLEEQTLSNLQFHSLAKKQLFVNCKRILDQHKAITVDVIRVVADIMEAEGIIFHHLIDGKLIPLIESGMTYMNTKELATETAKYVAYNSKETLNIEELVSEPLWENQSIYSGRALLSCPIFCESQEVIGVLEFFRNRVFTSQEQFFAEELTEHIRTISTERCVPTVKNPDLPESPVKRTTVEQIYAEVSQLYTFALEVTDLFNYQGIMDELSVRTKNLITLDDCTLYIADQEQNCLWTQKSESCDPLVYPLTPDCLYGVVCARQEMVEFPGPDVIVSDYQSYEGQSVLCLPLVSSSLVSGTIGLFVLRRREQPFSEVEKSAARFVSSRVRELLENWFLQALQHGRGTRLEKTESFGSVTNQDSFRHKNQHYQTNSIRRLSTRASVPPEKAPVKSIREVLNSLLCLASIPQNRLFEVKRVFSDIGDSPENCLKILAQRLTQMVPCQKACLLMIDTADQHVVDIQSQSLMKESGLIHQCILKKQIIKIDSNVAGSVFFDRHIDCLGLEQVIDNFLAVPIFSFIDNVLGVFVFVNASICFSEEDVAMAEFLALLPREFVFSKDEGLNKLQTILKTGRRHKMLQHWCKQIFFVANSTQQNMTLAQNILHRLFEDDENLNVLIQASLEILCVIINTEKAALIHKDGNELHEITLNNGAIVNTPLLTHSELVLRTIELMQPFSDNQKKKDYENMLIVPLVQSKKELFAIKALNKRDDTLTYYCNFTKADEIMIAQFLKAIASAYNGARDPNNKEALAPLTKLIRQRASSMNTFTLISTIRSAAQKLLDCDRATVFIREDNHMVMKAQGIESEIPEGFRIPIGKGIIGNVAQTAQVENIKDVYTDHRFNTEVDKRTGYKTSTMLCMPVLDTDGTVLAALQMINKRHGFFDESDEETLEIFCEIISTVLKNWDTFQRNIEEKNRYLNILNSLGTYIIVISEEGKLMYCNKEIDDLFRVEEKAAQQSHYSSWLRTNRQLVYDITSVQQRLQKRIYRTAQTISVTPLKRTRTHAALRKFDCLTEKELIFNYTVASLQDYFSPEKFGIVLILEDATNFQELNMKFSKIEDELKALKNPVQTETPLQKCIEKLHEIDLNIEDPAVSGQLREIVSVLQQGNVNKIEVTFTADLNMISDHLRRALAEYTELEPTPAFSEPLPSMKVRVSDLQDQSSMLTELHELNMDVFSIDNYPAYIASMLLHFDLLEQFKVNDQVLSRFVNEVHDQYEIWNNPYHNFVHGFNVMHVTYLLLVKTDAYRLYSAHEIFGLLIASLCHDVQHTGKTNAFEVNRQSQLAILYNDKSVLENHHAAITFKILQSEKANVFASLPPDTVKSVRKLMVAAILATDMAVHFPMIANINARLKSAVEHPVGGKPEDSELFGGFLLHSADLGHPCARLDIYKQWSGRVTEEFTRQFKDELSMGLPPTELMKDLDRPAVYYDKEHGFLSFVVQPLWDLMDKWLHPNINQYIEQLGENIQHYAEMKEKLKAESE